MQYEIPDAVLYTSHSVRVEMLSVIFMAAPRSRCGHSILQLWLLLVSWLITRFRNRVPGCWNRVTRIKFMLVYGRPM